MEVTGGPRGRALEVILVAEGEKVNLCAFSPRGLHLTVHLAILEGRKKLSAHQLVQIRNYEDVLLANVPRTLLKIVTGIPLLLPFAHF